MIEFLRLVEEPGPLARQDDPADLLRTSRGVSVALLRGDDRSLDRDAEGRGRVTHVVTVCVRMSVR
jgi:hypothetical protein